MNFFESKTDIEIVSLLILGDQLTYEFVYKKYSGLLFQYAYNRIGVKEDSEEIVQEVFAWLWANRLTLSNVDALKPYLYGMMKHKIISYIKHSAVKQKYIDSYAKYLGNETNRVEESVNLSDVWAQIDTSIAGLPERCQTAFKMSRVQHLSLQQISEQMNISKRTVENYITQALKHLRLSLKNFQSYK